ncbi:MAG: class I SAM-dependent methyltransferase [Nocardioidaceae bacterium]
MADSFHSEPIPAALSFGAVADAYDRARPSYPPEAARWLAGAAPADVLDLGAGTGKLTEQLAALGHRVVAADPLPAMLAKLARRVPQAPAVRASAERIPLRGRSVDVVTAGQSFHWFDLDRALPEIARVLRPGGRIALAWNLRDETVPWVRRLGRLIGTPEQLDDPTHVLLSSNLFGYVETKPFRFWQPLNRGLLRDLVTSRSHVATMSEPARERVLRDVDELYDGYGRGADGMLLPYVTHCYRAVVRAPAPEETAEEADERAATGPVVSDGGDGDNLLIDFR